MTKLIIVEGPDNVGKDLLINKLNEYFLNRTRIVHSGVPNTKDLFNYYYNGIIHTALDLYFKDDLEAVMLNRSFYGEYVYGPKYRNESKQEIEDLILKLEVGQLETFVSLPDIYFVLLTSSDIDLLVNNSDGKSISDAKEDIADEVSSFEYIFNKSSLPNKKMIYVNKGSSFRDKDSIVDEVIDFIESTCSE
jgi:hypothetical protein